MKRSYEHARLLTHSQFANFLLSSKINEQIFGQKKEHMIAKVNIPYQAPNIVLVMPFSTHFFKKYISW